MTPKSLLRPKTARQSRALHSHSDTCMQRPATMRAKHDCEEKRDPDERQRSQESVTMEKSLTQMPD